jgi:hypothetical protein
MKIELFYRKIVRILLFQNLSIYIMFSVCLSVPGQRLKVKGQRSRVKDQELKVKG